MTQIPREVATASDYELLAPRFIAPPVFAWLSGGSGDEQTLHGNREAFTRISLRNRLWGAPGDINTRLTLAGVPLTHPLVLAPVAGQTLLHPSGEVATAQGAQAINAAMVVSTLASQPLQEICATVQPCFFQLYWQQSLTRTLTLADAAVHAGCKALVLTLDTPVQSLSRKAQRAGFYFPPNLRAPALDILPPLPEKSVSGTATLTGMLQQSPSLNDIKALIAHAQLPVFVKGVLHKEDARIMRDCGAQGLIVSNHGGRALDGVLPTLGALPAVRESLGMDFPLLLDGGIRSGYDVFKALALGANAVLIGRLQAYALAVAGPLGVAHMMRLMLEELQLCMALTGCASLADIGPHTIMMPEK